MSTQRFVLTGLLILALLAPGASASVAEPAGLTGQTAHAPADDNYPPPDWTYGPATGTLAAAGDLNGDGFDDALIVDPQNAPWTPVTARLFYGSSDGLPAEPDWTLADHWQTCPAGDVNGDGFDDLFTASLDGLQVFYGSPSGPVPGAPWHGASVSLSGAGDVNGDGYDDLLAGDPYFTNGQEWEGQMLLYYGSPAGPPPDPDWTLQSDEAGRRMGERVLAVGDINGDGYDDIAFLSFHPSRYGSYRTGTHTLSIYLGSSAGPETTVHWTTTRYGTVTVTAGDIDGDGYDDLVIGEPGFPCNSYSCSGPGRVSVFRGSEGGLTTSSWRYEGGGGSRQLGKALTTAGDLNRDGYDDLIVGAASSTSSGQPIGQVLAFYGSSLGLASTPHWTAQHGEGSYGFGDRLALTGDVNGDGYDDLLAGNSAYSAGRTDCDLVRGFYGSAAGLRASRILARLVDQPPSIDGDLDDWTQLAGFTLDRTSAASLAGQPAQPSDAAASLQAVWTAADLYLALHITDDAIVSDSPEVWNDDEVEFGFYAVWDGNPAGGDTHQYTVNADDRVSDFGDPSVSIPVEAAAMPAPGGWDVEMRIPASHLFGFYNLLARGTSLTFNLGLHDDDDGGAWDSYLVWQGESTVGGASFGEMVMVAIGGPLEESTPALTMTSPDPIEDSIQSAAPAALGSAARVLRTIEENPRPDWTASGVAAFAGDINGDGFDDVAMHHKGGSWYDTPRVDLFFGSEIGLGNVPAWSTSQSGFSYEVTGVGDLNGDGFDDLAGSHYQQYLPWYSLGSGVFYGAPAGPEQVFDWGGPATASAAGDVNGDGFDDLLIGELTFSNGEQYEGRLLLFLGSPDGLGRSPDWMFESDTPRRYLGRSLMALGDVNGDGYDDIADGQTSSEPRFISVYLGSPDGLQRAAGEIPIEDRYESLSAAGDVNGDGFDDLLLGYPYYPDYHGGGRALLYLGSADGLSTEPDWTFESDHDYARFGETVRGAGDVNQDGFDDILISAPNYDYGTNGYVFGFLGDPRGVALAPSWVFWKPVGGWSSFGQLARIGDVNGDGYDDTVVSGNPYRSPESWAFYGTAAGLRETRVLTRRTNQSPTIDGDLSDWPPAARFTLDRSSAETLSGLTPEPDDASATLRTAWTTTDLYLAIHVDDDVIVNDSSDVWRDDEIELAFYAVYDDDPAGGDTHQYTVNADGRVTDFGNPDPPIEAVAMIVPNGWDVEVRIPSNTLYGFYHQLTAGTAFSFNLGLHDDDDGGNWDSYLVWQGTATIGGDGFGAMFLTTEDGFIPPTPTPVATQTPTATPSATATSTATATATPTATGTATATATASPTATATATQTATATATATASPTATATTTPTTTAAVHIRYLPLIMHR